MTTLHEALRLNRHGEAALLAQELLQESPDNLELLSLSGALARQRGDLSAALSCFGRALSVNPRLPELHNNLGVLLNDVGQSEEALLHFDAALSLAPRYAEAHGNRGNALRALEKSADALAAYREATACDPENPEGYYNLGNALRGELEWEEAVHSYYKLLALNPRHLSGWINLCGSFMALGRGDEATHAGRRAVLLAPQSPDAHWNLALALLCQGDFKNGWREYEWRRHDQKGFPSERAGRRLWDGSPIAGRTLFIAAEQGFGDAIQFVRFAAVLAGAGVRVVLECRPELRSLFAGQGGIAALCSPGEEPPPFDCFAYLMSLPLLLGTELCTIPNRTPYLVPDPKRCKAWKERLSGGHAMKVGVVWAGSAGYKNDRNRSLSAAHLAPLGELPDVELYSLQLGEPRRALSGSPPLLKAVDLSEEIGDFADTAALITELDLVIAVDTAVAHLAGALGKPVWILLPKGNDWRWLRDRDDSPWYPSARLFRQTRPGDWDGVLARVTAELGARAQSWSRLFKRGNDLADRGRRSEAIAAYGRLLEIEPYLSEAHNNLGLVLTDEGRLEEAAASYRRAIACKGELVDAHNNLGTVLTALGQREEAERAFERAIALAPDRLPPYLNLGSLLQYREEGQEAVKLYRQAIALHPNAPEPRINLATAYQELGDPERAIEVCRETLALNPSCADAHWNLALNLLMTGEFSEGWQEYEWRLKKSDATLTLPSWNGAPLGGEEVLLRCEQGFGDTFQFVRFVPLVARRGGRVVLECQHPSLKPLLARLPGVSRVISRREGLPAVRRYAPLLSLPRIFGTTLSSVPVESYLCAEPERAAAWRARLSGDRNVKVGIVWKGGPLPRNRACPFRFFAALKELRGVSFYSLQLGEPPAGEVLPAADLAPEIRDFGDTAAVIANLDLVISVDTAVAHLAGAMGRPVWTLLPKVADWRWLMGREDSPWYPTMRLFRQERGGDWEGVMHRVRAALTDLLIPLRG